MLDILREMFAGNVPVTELTEQPRSLGTSARLAPCGRAVRLGLGARQLLLSCERKITESDQDDAPTWLVGDAESEEIALRAFIRICPGETILLGRDNEHIQRLFDLPRSLPRRQLELRNEAGALLLRNLAPDHPSTLSLDNEAIPERELRASRLTGLSRLRTVFGGCIEALDTEDSLASLLAVVELLADEAYRPRNSKGRCGGLLELPDTRTPIIVGDLHGQLDNLLRILCEPRCLDALEHGNAYLLLLGDTVHREEQSELEEMDSSLLMLDFLCRLKLRFADSFFWLRGNHESFDQGVGKGGVPQGVLLRSAARKRHGEAYVQALTSLFDALPYVALSSNFIACHGGAPRVAVSKRALVEIHAHPDLAEQLVWVRPRRPSHPAGFGTRDVARFRAALGAAKNTPVIVGHTPLTDDGVLWMNAAKIPGLHVIFDARNETVPVFTRLRDAMVTLEYPAEPLLAIANATCSD